MRLTVFSFSEDQILRKRELNNFILIALACTGAIDWLFYLVGSCYLFFKRVWIWKDFVREDLKVSDYKDCFLIEQDTSLYWSATLLWLSHSWWCTVKCWARGVSTWMTEVAGLAVQGLEVLTVYCKNKLGGLRILLVSENCAQRCLAKKKNLR